MGKVKIFIYDDLVLGGELAHVYLQNQTYCFPIHSGPGFGLFFSKKRIQRAFLVADPAWNGCWGELWEVGPSELSKINSMYWTEGFDDNLLFLDGMPPVRTWTMKLSRLGGARLKRIDDIRQTR